MASTSKKLKFFMCFDLFSFLHVLYYHLVAGFSLTPSSIDDPEDNRCSLKTYQGLSFLTILYYFKFFFLTFTPGMGENCYVKRKITFFPGADQRLGVNQHLRVAPKCW